MTTQSAAEPQAEKGPIVARAGQYYRNTRYIMTFVLLLYGAWACYDGFYNWPEPHWSQIHPDEKPKTQMDIMFNVVLGTLLPPAGIALLIYSLRNSRGEYRLEDDVIYVPGHPPVPLNKIVKIDRELWEKKGIAYIEYKLDESDMRPGSEREFMLDDFVYERQPTDQIFKAIEDALLMDRGINSASFAPAPRASISPAARVAPAGSVAAAVRTQAPAKQAAPARQAPAVQPQAKPVAPVPSNRTPAPAPAARQPAAPPVAKPAAPVAKPVAPVKPMAPAPAAKPAAPAPIARPAAIPVNKPAPGPARPGPAAPVAPGARPPAPKAPAAPRTPPRPQL
jgi:hypothetical protein